MSSILDRDPQTDNDPDDVAFGGPLTRERLEEILSSPSYEEWAEEERVRAQATEYREAEWLERVGNDFDHPEA